MHPKFHFGGLVRESWTLVKERFWALLGLTLLTYFLLGIPVGFLAMIGLAIGDIVGGLLVFFAVILGLVLMVVFAHGWLQIGITVLDRKPLSVMSIFGQMETLLSFIATVFMFACIVTFGFILFVIPGYMWASRFALAPYLVVDKKMGPIEAFRASSKATEGYRFDIFAVQAFVSSAINAVFSAVVLPAYLAMVFVYIVSRTAVSAGASIDRLQTLSIIMSIFGGIGMVILIPLAAIVTFILILMSMVICSRMYRTLHA